MGDVRLEIFHSAIRAPRSGRILLRRDPIFQLANTVVSEVPKRAFQPAIDLGLQAAEMRQARKKWRGMRPSILTTYRTVTTRRADFAVYLPGSQCPRDDARA